MDTTADEALVRSIEDLRVAVEANTAETRRQAEAFTQVTQSQVDRIAAFTDRVIQINQENNRRMYDVIGMGLLLFTVIVVVVGGGVIQLDTPGLSVQAAASGEDLPNMATSAAAATPPMDTEVTP